MEKRTDRRDSFVFLVVLVVSFVFIVVLPQILVKRLLFDAFLFRKELCIFLVSLLLIETFVFKTLSLTVLSLSFSEISSS